MADDYGSYFGNDYDAYNTYDYGGGGDFGGSYDYGMPDYDYSMWLPPVAASEPTYTGISDVLRSYGPSYSDPYLSNLAADPSASVASANPWYSALTVPAGTGTGGGSILDRLLSPQGLLGIGSGVASLIGALSGGGVQQTQGPRPTTAQQANINRGYQMAEMGAMGNLPAQQMQMSLLNAIASGQGLAQPYGQAIERAFEPQLGSLYERAVQAGRRRGFHDAPATSPPGGAILGPGLSDLQGQIAAAKIRAMFDLPQLYNSPAQSQGQFASAFLGQAQNPNLMQTTTTKPLGPTIGSGVAGVLQGLGKVYGSQDETQQKAQRFDDLMNVLRGMQPSMTGA